MMRQRNDNGSAKSNSRTRNALILHPIEFHTVKDQSGLPMHSVDSNWLTSPSGGREKNEAVYLHP
jgi:hypothetical protein